MLLRVESMLARPKLRFIAYRPKKNAKPTGQTSKETFETTPSSSHDKGKRDHPKVAAEKE